MNKLNMAYCNECEDLVNFDLHNEIVNETYKGVKIQYNFNVARCKYCHNEVSASIDYNYEKSAARISAYKKAKGIISLEEISEIMEKYNIGKEPLSVLAGFGKVTIKRYFEGIIPAPEYSERLKKLLNDEQSFSNAFKDNIDKLNEVSVKKIQKRFEDLSEIKDSKINQIANYIIIKLEEVTPLALEKLLAFSEGVNYALNGSRLINDDCEAWQHGYVYHSVYTKYKKYGYKPIDSGIKSTHGVMLSRVSESELNAIDMVINTFGLYSPKTLELISHRQDPWLEKRVGYGVNDASNEPINEDSLKQYFVDNKLYSEENINKYISKMIRSCKN